MIKKFIVSASNGDNDTIFTTKYGLPIAKGYKRIVFGGRGEYIEFDMNNLIKSSLYIPKKQEWRLNALGSSYYIEYRSIDDAYVKVYHQVETVAYADYKIGLFYILPDDLYANNECVRFTEQSNLNLFFN